MSLRLRSWVKVLRQVPYFGAGVLFVHRPEGGKLEVFLAKRRINPHRGCWSIAGGKRELRDGGDFFATACREASEETCGGVPLESQLQKYLPSPLCAEKLVHWGYHWLFFNWKTFIVPLRDKPPRQEWPVMSPSFRHEFSDCGWFGVESLPQPLHPAIVKLVRLARKNNPWKVITNDSAP